MKLLNRFVKNLVLTTLFAFLFITSSTCALKDWTILLYVQSKNNLNKFAAKNLSDMACIGSSGNVNILVQWYQLNQNGTWRYKIEKNKIELDTFLPADTDGNGVNDLVESMRWAVTKYPAQKYFLILWNHGYGILDPIWGQLRGMRGLGPAFYTDNPRIKIDGLTKYFDLNASILDDDQRAILFNEVSKTYMNNQALVQALSKIKTDVLKNRKINILGMDACLMAMVEVAYQSKDFADYFVASQEVELAHGWDYLTIMQGLAMGNLSPSDLAKSIVLAYENYYKGKIQFYTQSAISLNKMGILKDSIDQIVLLIDKCSSYDKIGIKGVIKDARKKSLQFSTRSYVDLNSFYVNLCNELESYLANNVQNKSKMASSNPRNNNAKITNNRILDKDREPVTKSIQELKIALKNGIQAISNSILVNATGTNMSAAKGLSIYFPINRIDASYVLTDFAKESLWGKFIKDSL
jgi:hypothetical protein